MSGPLTKFFWPALKCATIVTLATGCAHQSTARDLDSKFAAESSPATSTDLKLETGETIATAAGLTKEQRADLLTLRDTAQNKIAGIRETMWKLRSILTKDMLMLTPTYDEGEVEAIKNRLSILEDERLSEFYGAISQANKILGRKVAQNQRVLHDFMDDVEREQRR